MSNFIKNQLQKNINSLQYVFDNQDIYGCEIKLKCNLVETDWLIITDNQVKTLIVSYIDRLPK